MSPALPDGQLTDADFEEFVSVLTRWTGPMIPGDLDGNGTVDGADIPGFVECFLQGPNAVPGCEAADMSPVVPDGQLTEADFEAFVSVLLNEIETLPGDLNDDGTVNMGDLPHFVDALLGNIPAHPGIGQHRADLNADGHTNGDDVEPFIHAILAG